MGPDDIPNELIIEANEPTKDILKAMIENVYKKEEIPPAWEEKIIQLCKGKGQRGKCSNERGIMLASNVGKVYERIINETVKKQITITKTQAGGKPWCATTDHLIVPKQTIQEITEEETNSVQHLLRRPKGLWQGMARRYHVRPPQKQSRREKLKNDKKLNSNLTARIQTRYGLTRRINIKDSIRQGGILSFIEYATLIDEISK